MIHDVLLPRTGSTSSDQATIVTWHVAVGAQVAVGDVVAEVETDKSVVDVESTVAGTVVELCAAEEDELTIGDLLLRVDDGEPTTGGAADQPPAPPAGVAAPPTGTDTRPTRAASPRPTPVDPSPVGAPPSASAPAAASASDASSAVSSASSMAVAAAPTSPSPPTAPALSSASPGPAVSPGRRVRATPAARRRGRELGVDLADLAPGSGPEGRVEVADVEAAAVPFAASTSPPSPVGAGSPNGSPVAGGVPGWARGLTGMRRTVALRMAESAALVAPVTLQRDLDVTDLTAWATRRPPQAPGGVLDALLALVARALVRHPDLNAHLLDTGIVEHDAVHLGYAVDGARGLVVPVVRDAAGLPVDELAERRRALVTAARAGKLGPDDQDGATFTVTNLGPLGIDHFSPIVNLPQVAILGLGAFRSTLDVGDDDTPVVRRKVGVSLTFDHRAVDGAPAARFLDRLARTAADPFELLA